MIYKRKKYIIIKPFNSNTLCQKRMSNIFKILKENSEPRIIFIEKIDFSSSKNIDKFLSTCNNSNNIVSLRPY